MCGICLIAKPGSNLPSRTIDNMVKRLSHRGPDATGAICLDGCQIGHARLSVIDLDKGTQPMQDSSGRYWITYNGELYNYKELYKELSAKGHPFHTTSDTEVVLKAYVEWGSSCLDRFRGMFAFAIWDTRDRSLFAARDLFGEKPLYFATTTDHSLLIASEIKALLSSETLRPRLDLGAVDAYLALGYVPPDRTIYENIKTLPPGHYLEWSGERLRVTRYWMPKLETHEISPENAAERLRDLLRHAVKRQMVADVPLGAFLSGGLDSSTIVALMQEQSTRPVKTFSVGFGNFINELPYARAVADLYKTEHHEIDLGAPPVAEMLERMISVYDEPFADSSHIPTYLISEFARQYVKVVLSGDGGDELFGGYWWYPPLALSEKMAGSWFKWVVCRTASKLLRDRSSELLTYSAGQGLAARWPEMWTRDVMSQTYFRDLQRRKLWAGRAEDVLSFTPGEYYRPPTIVTGMNQGFYFDLTCYLPGDILVKVDRAAMAHGLETRAPFLDRDLVEFALSLPAALKVNGDQTKIIFREAFSGYWPPEVRSRKKLGFGVPYERWLARPDVRDLMERVFSRRSLLRQLLPGLSPRQASRRSFQTWILLVLGMWLEQHPVGV